MDNQAPIKIFVTPLDTKGQPVLGGVVLPMEGPSFRHILNQLNAERNPQIDWGFSERRNGSWTSLSALLLQAPQEVTR